MTAPPATTERHIHRDKPHRNTNERHCKMYIVYIIDEAGATQKQDDIRRIHSTYDTMHRER